MTGKEWRTCLSHPVMIHHVVYCTSRLTSLLHRQFIKENTCSVITRDHGQQCARLDGSAASRSRVEYSPSRCVLYVAMVICCRLRQTTASVASRSTVKMRSISTDHSVRKISPAHGPQRRLLKPFRRVSFSQKVKNTHSHRHRHLSLLVSPPPLPRSCQRI